MAPESVHCIIHGLVQGVFFRASTQKEALRLRLAGWVKNLPDGGVELVAEGARAALEELVTWCHHGPPGATVDRVEVYWAPAQGHFASFTIVR